MPALQSETGGIAVFLSVVLAIFILYPGPLVLFYMGRIVQKSVDGYNSRELEDDDRDRLDSQSNLDYKAMDEVQSATIPSTPNEGNNNGTTNGYNGSYGASDAAIEEDSVMEDTVQVEMADIDMVTGMWNDEDLMENQNGQTTTGGTNTRTIPQHSNESFF